LGSLGQPWDGLGIWVPVAGFNRKERKEHKGS
jgi:hypothetical protein